MQPGKRNKHDVLPPAPADSAFLSVQMQSHRFLQRLSFKNELQPVSRFFRADDCRMPHREHFCRKSSRKSPAL